MEFLKKFSSVAMFLAVIFAVSFCSAAKKTVMVMPLENISGYNEQKVAEIMTQQLITAIHGSGNYTVVERFQTGEILKEQGFQNIAGNPNKSVEQNNFSGADYTLFGKVTMAEFINNPAGALISKLGKLAEKYAHQSKCKIKFEFRLVDNSTGEVVVASTVEGCKSGVTKAEAFNEACKDASENFLREIQKANPLVAKVVEISGQELYIDKGSHDGLREGETLVILRESDAIIVNGKIVGMKRQELGKAKVIEINAEYSICKVVEGVGIRKGDVLKRG